MSVDLEKLRADVLNAVATTLGKKPEEVDLSYKILDNEEIDPFDNIEIIMAVEAATGVEISDEDAEKLTTVEEVVAYVYSKLDVNAPVVKTDEEILAAKEEDLTEEEKVKKVAIVKNQEEDVLLAKPEAELTEEEKELIVKIKETREAK